VRSVVAIAGEIFLMCLFQTRNRFVWRWSLGSPQWIREHSFTGGRKVLWQSSKRNCMTLRFVCCVLSVQPKSQIYAEVTHILTSF